MNVNILMGENNTVVSAYTLYRHLQQYCSHLSIHVITVIVKLEWAKKDKAVLPNGTHSNCYFINSLQHNTTF